jgi:hypothetical protein
MKPVQASLGSCETSLPDASQPDLSSTTILQEPNPTTSNDSSSDGVLELKSVISNM